jgi:hypothetical protein
VLKKDTFFLGTGDVNSTFLPPLPKSGAQATDNGNMAAAEDAAKDDVSVENQIARVKMLDEQAATKPLAKAQAELDAQIAEEEGPTGDATESGKFHFGPEVANRTNSARPSLKGKGKEVEKSTTPPSSPVRARKTVFNLEDDELSRVAHVSPPP